MSEGIGGEAWPFDEIDDRKYRLFTNDTTAAEFAPAARKQADANNSDALITGRGLGHIGEDKVSITGTLNVIDRDTGQDHPAVANNVAATYGTWSINATGQWTYKLNSSDSDVQSLIAGQSLTDSFTVFSQDGTASRAITITINGTNDVPTMTGDTVGNVTESVTLTATGTLVIDDRDTDQSHTRMVGSGSAKYGTWSVDADGHWSYELDDSDAKVQALGAGDTLIDRFVVVSDDGTARETVVITITGSNDTATITGDSFGSVLEDTWLTSSGTLTVSDVDTGEAHTQVAINVASTYGHWSVDGDGHWDYDLDEDNQVVQSLGVAHSISDSFTVFSLDGSAQQTVTINIGGINDVPEAEAAAVSGSWTAVIAGQLAATDIDQFDTLTYSLETGGDPLHGSVVINTDGSYSYTPASGYAGTDHFTYQVSDGHGGISSAVVTVTLNAPNNAPVLEATAIGVAFTAATSDGWAVWVSNENGQPVPVATFGTFPQHTLWAGGRLYFAGSDPEHGNELWSYDVVTGVANRLTDIWPGSSSSNLSYLAELGGKLYFAAYDGTHGGELWVFDPATETASLAADILSGTGGGTPQYLTAAGGKLYFQAYNSSTGGELWVYDPTTHAATLAKDIFSGNIGSWPAFITELGGKLVFAATDGVRGNELWIYDPATGTASYKDVFTGSAGSSPGNFEVVGGKLYFSGQNDFTGSKIFVYDPASGSVALAGSPISASSPAELTALDGKLYYIAYLNNSYELFVYDPVTQVHQMATDQPLGFTPSFIESIGGQLYFSCDDGINGRELWVFDPATGHASLFADVSPGTHVGFSDAGVEINGKLYFHAHDNAHGGELWVFDPTTNTLGLAAETWPGPNGTYTTSQAAVLNGKLYFPGSSQGTGTEVWVYDPATGTASLAADIVAGGSSSPQFLTALAGKLYFFVEDTLTGTGVDLWAYNPATGMSAAVQNFAGGMDAMMQSVTTLGGKLYFSANDGVNGAQLWVFNPATQHADMLTNMGPTFMQLGAEPTDLTVLGGKLYFNADDGVNGRELWVYNPATATASLAKDIFVGTDGGNPRDMVVLGSKLYFRAANDLGVELWSYDPATGVATLVKDIVSGTDSSAPADLMVLDGKIYFTATDAEHGRELCVYDPVANSVTMVVELGAGSSDSQVHNLSVIDGKLLFVTTGQTGTDRLWVYDPVTHTTTLANVLGDVPNSSNPQQIAGVVSDGMELQSISENATSNFGSSVAAILGIHATDADGDAIGVAITGADTSHGDWQYSLDNGATWVTLGAVSDQSATLLDNAARIRFVPDAGWTGTAEITVHAWDQTDNHHSGNSGVDVSANGAETAFSSTAVLASIEVEAVHVVNGSSGSETMLGTIFADVIDAGQGSDVVIGGTGGDRLLGGAGADHFKYALASHSTLSHLDVIGDFNAADGDMIDFAGLGLSSGITDGGVIGGFGVAPASSFGGHGLIVETDGVNTRIYADSDHSGTFNAATDMVIQLTGNHLNELITQPSAIVIV